MMKAMLGRITVYSIVGCPHCIAAKTRLKEENLQFFDVSVDKFPDHVRDWVREKTGKTSVPQIFFNSTYIGGNKELQDALNDDEKRKTIRQFWTATLTLLAYRISLCAAGATSLTATATRMHWPDNSHQEWRGYTHTVNHKKTYLFSSAGILHFYNIL